MLFLKLCKRAVPFSPFTTGVAADLGGQVFLGALYQLVPRRFQEASAVVAPPHFVVHQSAELRRLVHGDEHGVGEIQLLGNFQERLFWPSWIQ